MKKGKYLEFYKKCVELGELPGGWNANGLCHSDIQGELFDLFEPTQEDIFRLHKEDLCTAYWASEMIPTKHNDLKGRVLSPLRQNIILFCAAMNGEL